jgi:dynein heavy chain
MRALRDFNTPKIPTNDIPIFLRLISDLFPGLPDLKTKVNVTLYKSVVDVCKINSLQSEETFISKVLQFQELCDVRHSVMLLGPAGCGKSTVWKTLAGCHNHEKVKHVTVYETINPKSINTDELYGYMTLTKDWKDGVLSIIMRDMTKNVSPFSSHQTNKWVVFDGDIDAGWIESMNTVMDDNKVLTLVSNERIPLNDSMRMIFEIDSLKHATPATVSRAGILYINDTDVGYQPFVDSWLGSRTSDAERIHLPDLFDRYLSKIIDFFITTKIKTYVNSTLINLVQSFIYLLEGLIKSTIIEKTRVVFERLFIFATMWGFGGCISTDKNSETQKAFSVFMKGLVRTVKFPDQGDILEYYLDPSSGEPVPWVHKIPGFSSSAPDYSSSTIVVPTAESVRLTYLLKTLVRNGKHVMFVGPAGTGKSVLVGDYLSSLAVEAPDYRYVHTYYK